MKKRLRIILSAERRDFAQQIERVLSHSHHQVVAVLEPEDDLVAYAQQAQAEVVVIERLEPTPLLLQQLRQLNETQPVATAVFVDRSGPPDIQAAVKAGVSAYVVDGFRPDRVEAVLQAAMARFLEFQALRRERDQAQTKLAERKNIERAKGILMRRRRLPEDEAYATLRKMAMERNKRLIEVAESIVTAEELLAQN